MNKSRLTLVLSLATLLGGGLVLPGAVSAHDRSPSFQVERGHHAYYGDHHNCHHDTHWYLQRHYDARPYGYRPIKRSHRHQQHQHKHHRPHAHKRHQHRDVSPTRLEIGYEIVL